MRNWLNSGHKNLNRRRLSDSLAQEYRVDRKATLKAHMPIDPDEFPEFDEVLESCRRFLLAIANKELPLDLRAKGGASDLVQQTLASAVQSRHQFRGNSVGELRAWLRSILHSEAAVFRRRFTQTAARDVGREEPLNSQLAVRDQAPDELAVRAEHDENLATAMRQLSHEQHQAVALRMDDGMSFAEIGVQLGRSEEAARKLFTRAIDRLRVGLVDGLDDHA